MTRNPLAVQLPLPELIQAFETAGVLQIMANEQRKSVTVDYIPPRSAMAIPRECDDEPLQTYPQKPIKLTFTLEDAMFGGTVYAAVLCGHRVLVKPFEWKGYQALGLSNPSNA